MSTSLSSANPVVEYFPAVRELIHQAILSYPDCLHPLRAAMLTGLSNGRVECNELSLPLLVHASITNDAAPAVPVAAVHSLWWRAANAFDDIADGDCADGLLNGAPVGVGLMAAQEYGYCLPLKIIDALPVPELTRRDLSRDYLTGWTDTNDGQIRDLLNDPLRVGRDDVLTTYVHKSSSAYVMAVTMAARLACPSQGELEQWQEFARILGLLAQLRNDRDDLAADDQDDLRNQTATFLLVVLLESDSGARRNGLADLLRAAPASRDARDTLCGLVTQPDNLERALTLIRELRARALSLVDTLTRHDTHADELRSRVEQAARLDATAVVSEPAELVG